MTYEQFLAESKKIDEKLSEQESIIHSFPKHANGLVSEEVRLNPTYRQAVRMFDFWFKVLRSLNTQQKVHVKTRGREIIAARMQKGKPETA